MSEVYSITNLLLVASFLFVAGFVLFPLEIWLQSLLQFRINRWVLLGVVPFALLFAVAGSLGVAYVLLLLLSLFNFWAFLFAVNVDRSFVYILALVLLGLTPLLLLLNMDDVAEYSAVLSYLALVVGAFKDIFYAKIFKE